VLVLLAAGLLIVAPLNADAGYCLVASRRVLAGQRLYVDMIETNPPFIFWLMMVPALAGQLLSIGDARTVGIFAAAVLLISSVTTVRVFNLPPALPRVLRFGLLAGFLTALVAPYLGQVGQREQLAAMLLLPYAALAVRAMQGLAADRPISIWCGVLGGIGLAIKPFFLAAWLAIEVAVVLSRHRVGITRRAEVWSVVLVQCAYAVLVLTLTPEYRTHAVPLAQAMYGSYGISRAVVGSNRRFLMLSGIAIATLLTAQLSPRSAASAHARVFGAATVGWLLAYVVQGKGWQYHLLPAIPYATAAMIAAAVAAAGSLSRSRDRKSRAGAALLLLAVIAIGIWVVPTTARFSRGSFRMLRDQYPQSLRKMIATVDEVAPGEPIYVMSTNVWPTFPLVNLTSAPWPYRYHFLWTLPALYAGAERHAPYRRPHEQGPIERQFFDTVVGDLVRVPPRVLIVERGPYLQAMDGRQFDFIEYFAASAEFRALMTRYRRLGFIERWEVFELR